MVADRAFYEAAAQLIPLLFLIVVVEVRLYSIFDNDRFGERISKDRRFRVVAGFVAVFGMVNVVLMFPAEALALAALTTGNDSVGGYALISYVMLINGAFAMMPVYVRLTKASRRLLPAYIFWPTQVLVLGIVWTSALFVFYGPLAIVP